MVQIVLTSEQVAQFAAATGSVELVGPEGRRIGVIPRHFTEAEIQEALARRASDEPRWPTSVVLDRLKGRDAS